MENIECLVSLTRNISDCSDVANSIYHDYAEFKRNHIPERDEPSYTTNSPRCV